ncbi:TfdA family taurine dioxygenase [Xylaria bambusicola]|uniref:TfdA family taurine dioxygenase n=1 Tax=Xylaria bambusicola TaxID=326684 RepID=UPI002007DA21|nr:TfdA family taurine dioxygenase [Xylaria bambusicola]KAI0506763.1 TfdA family taurine dioxygenase [Xylaria bambusicola]
MATTQNETQENGMNGNPLPASKLQQEPLKNSGSIDHLKYVDVTPIIGREYPTAKIKDILAAPNSDQQLRDLAITICERGVVFFRAPQDDLTVEEQKHVTYMLGKLTGRPEGHGLHVHPLDNDPNNLAMADGTRDPNIYVINSEAMKKLYKTAKRPPLDQPRDLSREWHSDSCYENCPSDFSFLRMQDTPPSGGDTLWCSGYELYDRMSPSFRGYLETLTATCSQYELYKSACEVGGYEVISPRGSPLNKDFEFSPSHPVVRTHPVTGWKSVFAGAGLHVTRINGVTSYEDTMIRDYVMRLITRNHDGVARMHWTRQSCAIWHNACTLHAATPDTHLVDDGLRVGVRATGIGEVPYLDPASKGRREALGLPLY